MLACRDGYVCACFRVETQQSTCQRGLCVMGRCAYMRVWRSTPRDLAPGAPCSFMHIRGMDCFWRFWQACSRSQPRHTPCNVQSRQQPVCMHSCGQSRTRRQPHDQGQTASPPASLPASTSAWWKCCKRHAHAAWPHTLRLCLVQVGSLCSLVQGVYCAPHPGVSAQHGRAGAGA